MEEKIKVVLRMKRNAIDEVNDGYERGLRFEPTKSYVDWIYHAEERRFVLDRIFDVSRNDSEHTNLCQYVGDILVSSALEGVNAAALSLGHVSSSCSIAM